MLSFSGYVYVNCFMLNLSWTPMALAVASAPKETLLTIQSISKLDFYPKRELVIFMYHHWWFTLKLPH